jgi:predicted RNA-binding protein with PUA-like domain
MKYWLIKSEPDVFSIDDLKRVTQEPWTGVRNYQARNFMWKDMQVGDLAIFYHSNAKPPGAAGVAKVASAAYPDVTQFEEGGEYYDAKATKEKPRWWLVDFSFVARFDELLPLEKIKSDPAFSDMLLCQPGTRLSITPLDPLHFEMICERVGCSL